MNLYEAIFIRRAVRKYSKNNLDEKVLKGIEAFCLSVNQLNGLVTRLKIVTGDKVNDNKAPYYILAYCTDTAEEYINAGFVLEKVDLYLQSLGLGSVWLGIPQPKEKSKEYCVMLGFGETTFPSRKKASEFNRLPAAEIASEVNEIAKAARLAPSSMNSQPWKLKFKDNKVVIEYTARSVLSFILKKKMNMIDLGIITRFTELALLNESKTIKAIEPKVSGKEISVEISFS